MDIKTEQELNVGDPEAEPNKVDLLEGISSNGEVIRELGGVGEVLRRVELDITCSSEKLVNLNILMMHVATRECGFEAFASDKEHMLADYIDKAMEFDLLSGILDSEVREMDKFMATLEEDIVSVGQIISSYKRLGGTCMEMEEKLLDSENTLKQSQEQILEIKMQTAKFQKALSCLDAEENWSADKSAEFVEDDSVIKMQTALQQRHILRELEQSLAREMDLDKKLAESRQIEKELHSRLLSSKQEVLYVEEEAKDACERWLEADNASEVLMGISKELLGRLQIVQFNLNSSVQRETALRSKVDGSVGQLETKDIVLQKLESRNAQTEVMDKLTRTSSEASSWREKAGLLEKQLNEYTALCAEIVELENAMVDLKEKLSESETRAEKTEARCRLLFQSNVELMDELALLKRSGATSEKVDSFERQLRESDIRLEHAVASAEANQEKQDMLYSTIKDMEKLIKDLKLKISKADSRADSAEEKLITLSESNAGLTEELSFLRDRVECLEASLHQAEETKMATAKDIGIRTKIITNLVMQLAIERERLHQQISSLAMENRILKSQQTNKGPSIVMSHEKRGTGKSVLFPECDLCTAPCARESEEDITELSPTYSEDETQKNVDAGETVDSTPEVGTVRRIDVGLLDCRYVLAVLIVAMAAAAAYLFQNQKCPFDAP